MGGEIKVDKVGNIFAIYSGKNRGAPCAIGSHLDTQPTGGRYDGVLGVLAGLEVLKTMKDNNYVPNYPIAVVNWTNEEVARFPMSMMASSLWAENVPEELIMNLESITDQKPVTVEHELKRIGFNGELEASYKKNPLAAHFELHIEQGPVLENEEKKIGIVTGVQAYDWYKVTIQGRASHTGTTPLNARSDAIFAASQTITKCREIAIKNNGLVSVGVLEVEPGVVNVIPKKVSFTYDARHIHDEGLLKINEDLVAEFKRIAHNSNGHSSTETLRLEFEHMFNSKAVHFHEACINCVRNASVELLGSDQVKEIVSGAGHDSCPISIRCQISMISIPSRNGISHNPEEFSTPEQINEGFEVLLRAVLSYDKSRKN